MNIFNYRSVRTSYKSKSVLNTDQVVDLLQREAHADQHRLAGVVARPDVRVVVLQQLVDQPVLVRQRRVYSTTQPAYSFLTQLYVEQNAIVSFFNRQLGSIKPVATNARNHVFTVCIGTQD